MRTPREILAAQVMETPQPVTEFRPSVPPALEALIMRCLAKKPADRWQSAEEMLPHLDAFTTPSAGMTPFQMTPEPGTEPVKKGWPGWVKVAVPVGAVALGLGLWMGLKGPAGPGGEDGGLGARGGVGGEEVTRFGVLPLENLTEDPSLDALARRAADQITYDIDRRTPAQVIPAASVRGAQRELAEGASPAEIAENAGATHLLAGTVDSEGAGPAGLGVRRGVHRE